MAAELGAASAADEQDDDTEVGLDSGGFSVDLEQESTEYIHEPFQPEKIDVRTRNMTVDLLLARIRRGALDLAPDFQRRAGIWGKQNRSRLIESLLLRIPLPHFYVAESDDGDTLAVVDGIQRLTTIAQFIDPESIGAPPLKLSNLEYLTDYDGASYDDLPGPLQTRLSETELIVHQIMRGTPEEVKFNIFGRINTGGMPLSHQELRHALIPGPARDLLAELARSTEFQEATQGSVGDARMSDREMVLRFLAFRLSSPQSYDTDDLDIHLRRAMSALNRLSEEDEERLKSEFRWAMKAAIEVFGEHAFRKRGHGQQGRNPVNKALFEAVAVNLASLSRNEVDTLAQRAEHVHERLADLLATKEFSDAISVGTGSRAKVRRRFSVVEELFTEVAHA